MSRAHRVTVADIEKELAELRDSQERGKISMEHSVSEASIYLQDQVRLPHFAEQGPGPFSESVVGTMGAALPPLISPSLGPLPCVCVFQEVTVSRAQPLLTQNWLRGHRSMSTHH